MSRIGKVPVKIPGGVQVSVVGQKIEVKGSKGTLSREFPRDLKIEVKDNQVFVSPAIQSENVKALWGLYKVLIDNMVIGVSQGYKKILEVVGVGYKAELKGKDLSVAAGFSSPKMFKARQGVTFTVDGGTKITVEGIDKELVGQAAADIRRIRPPEPYKGKGIRYLDEKIRRKAGKTAGK
ncbi:MAG: 50S ribosomal protein L6 [Fibrobacter sp.]|nr:50S ribosomal protein L6 [Fibrobacter sp.]